MTCSTKLLPDAPFAPDQCALTHSVRRSTGCTGGSQLAHCRGGWRRRGRRALVASRCGKTSTGDQVIIRRCWNQSGLRVLADILFVVVKRKLRVMDDPADVSLVLSAGRAPKCQMQNSKEFLARLDLIQREIADLQTTTLMLLAWQRRLEDRACRDRWTSGPINQIGRAHV